MILYLILSVLYLLIMTFYVRILIHHSMAFFSYEEEIVFCIYQEYFKQFILRREYLFIYL